MDMEYKRGPEGDDAGREAPRDGARDRFEALAKRATARRHEGVRAPDEEPVPEAILSVPEALRPFARYMGGRDARPASMKTYVKKAGRARRLLIEAGFDERFADEPLETFPWHCVSPEVAHRFTALLRDRYPNAKTRENLIGAVRRLVGHSAGAGLISVARRDQVLEALPVPSRPRCRSGRELSVEEVRRLLAAQSSPRPRVNARDTAIIAVFLATGLRVSEVAEIIVDDVSLDEEAASIWVRRTKSGRSRTVFLSGSATALVRAWVKIRGEHPGALFDSALRPGAALSTEGVRQMLERRAAAAGLSRHFSSHDFRRTFATRALRANVDPFTVQRLLGHVNVQTTLVYDHRTEVEDREVVERLDVIAWMSVERRDRR